MTYITANTTVQTAIKQLDTAIVGVGTSLLPTGTTGQTLRNNAGAWVASSLLFNNGTSIGIGTTSPNASTVLGILGGVAIGSQSYSDKQAPASGLIVEGNVGIGTTGPGVKLDIIANQSGYPVINIRNTNTGGYGGFDINDESGNLALQFGY